MYVGMYGMGKSLVSVGPTLDPLSGDGNPAKAVLSDNDRKREVEELLDSCRRQVRTVLESKLHVVEGIRDALLEREELIGDEIEELMAQLGEREPMPVPVVGDGQDALGPGGNGQPGPGGDGQTPQPRS
jgi:ATP-dependent Zn protease